MRGASLVRCAPSHAPNDMKRHQRVRLPLWFHRPYRRPMEQRANIGPRYAIRLRDLRGWHMLIVACSTCRHKAHVRLWVLTERHSPDTFLTEVERKLRCSRCGHRGENVVLVTMMPR